MSNRGVKGRVTIDMLEDEPYAPVPLEKLEKEHIQIVDPEEPQIEKENHKENDKESPKKNRKKKNKMLALC